MNPMIDIESELNNLPDATGRYRFVLCIDGIKFFSTPLYRANFVDLWNESDIWENGLTGVEYETAEVNPLKGRVWKMI